MTTITINLSVEGMMCQKNCGSTVQSSLLNMDLDPVRSFLRRQLQSIICNDAHQGTAVEVDVSVATSEADFATSFASVVIEWGLVSQQQQSQNNDLLDYNATSSVEESSNTTDETNIDTLQYKLTTIVSTPEVHAQFMKVLSDLAIEEVECVGFDAAWLQSD